MRRVRPNHWPTRLRCGYSSRHERNITALVRTTRGGSKRARRRRTGSRVRRKQPAGSPSTPAAPPPPSGPGVGFVLSHEQFTTAQLVDQAASSRAGRLPLPVGQRPPPAMAGQRGPFDVPLDHVGVGGPANQPHPVRHRRDVSHLSLPPDDGRAGVRVARGALSRPGFPRRRHRRAAQRAGSHHPVRAIPGTPRPIDRSHPTHPATMERTANLLSRALLSDQSAQALRPTAVGHRRSSSPRAAPKAHTWPASTATAGSARPAVSKTRS